jgi:hypothetical protein
MKQKLDLAGFVCLYVFTVSVLSLVWQHTASAPPGSIEIGQSPLINKVESVPSPLQSQELVNNSEHTTNKPIKSFIKEKLVDNKIISSTGNISELRVYKPLVVPNDPNVNQWWTSSAKLEQAWDIPSGSNPTTLAIIDTGFALAHEEFANRWYQNTDEVGSTSSEQPSMLNCSDRSLTLNKSCNLIDDDYDGVVDNESGVAIKQNPSRLNCTDSSKPLNKSCNLIDDDSNGLIDDVSGWDFINFDNSSQAGEINPNGSDTHHGTYVSGAAAATGNNNKGIAGVDWNTKILPLQALDDEGYGNSLSVARAIRYAASEHAQVISLSLGSDLSDDVVRQAVREAIAAGSVVVAAAGNDGCNCISYPANYPEVVAVGALNTQGNPASFSSYGENLDILAPGVGLYTTDWQPNNRTSAYAANISGTSLSTPIVSGLLTRLLSYQPNETPQQLVALLTENTNKSLLGSLGRSNTAGYGTLDALKTTQRITTAINPQMLYSFGQVSSGNQIQPNSPAQPASSGLAYQCDNTTGTTPIYELSKGSQKFFTSSSAEMSQAVGSGFSSTIFAYACLTQPQDKPDIIRSLNIFREFKDINTKL